uniref:DUF834 domain-containing protein n=1 Tax=Oryza barthii TaxID=65489 RepID=A0A0D3G3N9_9ORYZ
MSPATSGGVVADSGRACGGGVGELGASGAGVSSTAAAGWQGEPVLGGMSSTAGADDVLHKRGGKLVELEQLPQLLAARALRPAGAGAFPFPSSFPFPSMALSE